MKAVWSALARQECEALPVRLTRAVVAETATIFSDAIPGMAVESFRSGGLLTIELPCGIEVEFERTGDGVLILHVWG